MRNDRPTRERFAAVMNGLAENFGQSISAVGAEMRFMALLSFELADIERAAMSMLISRKYTSMPTVADFIEHLGGGGAEDLAEAEARKVLRAVAEHGRYKSVVFDNPVTQAAIEQGFGSWPGLCAALGVEVEERWFLKDFAKTWAAFKRQGLARFGYLPGLVEIENAGNGYLDNSNYPGLARMIRPVEIGDPERARRVLDGDEGGKPFRAIVSELAKAVGRG